MFAVVDIETTGGAATSNGITEIAIILHNGINIEGKYATLINPQKPIQKYVQTLTGITDEMVADAPLFSSVAGIIYNLLHNKVFVAHNVSFDYSFVKFQLEQSGFILNTPKFCTLKHSRKTFPGLAKYGLESLAQHFQIENKSRHRAMGDAMTTVSLLQLLIAHEKNGELKKIIKKGVNNLFKSEMPKK